MAFGRKEKKNPSSRYSRIEEPWLDDEDKTTAGDSRADYKADGYGVRDSYSRQASYGRPDGYYDQGADDGLYDDDLGYSDADSGRYSGRESGYDDRYSGRDREYDDRYSGRGGSYDDRYSGRDSGYDDRYSGRGGSYDDRYSDRDGAYDDPYYGDGREPYRDGGYGEYDDYDDEYDSRKGKRRGKRSSKHARSGEYGQGGAVAAKKPHSKAGFIIKLVLLLIAAAVLILVWRFSRMKHVSLTDVITNTGIQSPTGYKEFVIYGVDSREGNLTKEAHSDTIILCSMNQSTKEIRLVSVYRDTYLDNTNGEYRKATECYYFGGPSRSVNMLNKNLDLDLHDYITVDFNAVIKAVDLIGGVDVEVTEDELPYINGYQTENAQVTGAEITPVESAGYQHLNGIQALAYCRIRYTAGSDYRRTERQRLVLSQIFEKARSQGAVVMAQMVDTMLPYIATSFSSADLLSLATSVSDYSMVDSVGFPFELQAANIAAGDCVVPVNLAQNVSELHAYLYQKSNYVPSETVQQISNEIANTTGIY